MLSAFFAFLEEGDEVIVFEPFFDQCAIFPSSHAHKPDQPPADTYTISACQVVWLNTSP